MYREPSVAPRTCADPAIPFHRLDKFHNTANRAETRFGEVSGAMEVAFLWVREDGFVRVSENEEWMWVWGGRFRWARGMGKKR